MHSFRVFLILLMGFMGGTSLLMPDPVSAYKGNQSHKTHIPVQPDEEADPKGPKLQSCLVCHGLSTKFADEEETLAATGVCDTCHSPEGAFNGVGEIYVDDGDGGGGMIPPEWIEDNPDSVDYGAKYNWKHGIYEDDGVTLKSGKDKWCATCHDDDPAYSRAAIPDPTSFVDNSNEDKTTRTGTWYSSTGVSGYYEDDYEFHLAGPGTDTFTWTPTIITQGTYEVFANWTAHENRAPDATYTIYYDGGLNKSVSRNQRYNGGEWVSLGTFFFNGKGGEFVELVQSSNGVVVADAVKIAPPSTFAPNVIGDDEDYGFYVTGHKINCLSCHDAGKNHIDHKHRTYVSTSSPNNYQAGYRLKSVDGGEPMLVPRAKRSNIWANLEDFALCVDCHNPNEVIGQNLSDKSHTNFKNDSQPRNYHYYHLSGDFIPWTHFDSDRDGVLDSHGSCIACHDPHGPHNQAMIRRGKLIDKEPALNFCYLTEDLGSCDTGVSLQDSVGSMINPNGSTVAGNGVCAMGCHTAPVGPGSEDLIRIPYLGPKVIGAKAEPETVPVGEEAEVILSAFVLNHSSSINVESVTVPDLSPIGGVEETMYDDGDIEYSGDEVAGDGIYSCKTIVADHVSGGEKSLWVEADTSGGLSGQGEIIIKVTGEEQLLVDNPNGTITGTWYISTGVPGYYGDDYEYHFAGTGSDTFTWTPTIITQGTYEVFARWTAHENRATDATYTIYHDGGTTDIVKDQQSLGGNWVSLGTFDFNGEGIEKVVLIQSENGVVVADAVKWEVPTPPVEKLLVDNPDGFHAGTWYTSTGVSGYYGDDYEFHLAGPGTDTFTWIPTITESGTYEVFANWTAHSNRATEATYTIYHDDGITYAITRNQTEKGGEWVPLGTFDFNGEGIEKVVLIQSENGVVVADAIKWELVPEPEP